MKVSIIIILMLVCYFVTPAQEIKNYMLDVDIDVAKRKLDVQGTIEIDFQNKDSITLLLWENTTIHEINIGEDNVEYSFDTSGTSPIIYIPNGRKLVLKNIKDKNTISTIKFSYTCDMKKAGGWAKSFSEDWIELGYYTAWYPVHNGSKNFHSTLNISIDNEYKVSGSGMVTQNGNSWEIKHYWPVFDNVIIAAKDLKVKSIGNKNVKTDIVYTKFPESDIDSISFLCSKIFEYYSEIYGKQENAYLKYVINPLKGMGGYSRKKFVCIKASEFNQYLREGIAHEMAHFWWNMAETGSWEDWLNEAFAEYSMLIYLREKGDKDKKIYEKHVNEFREWTKDTPPIWGIDRASPDAYAALYNKGSLILLEFEDKIGSEAFYGFLRKLIVAKVSTTKEFLKLIEIELSIEESKWFENKLKS